MKVLLVEDDVLLGDGLRAGALQAGDAVEWVRDGPGALEAMTRTVFDKGVGTTGRARAAGRRQKQTQGTLFKILTRSAR